MRVCSIPKSGFRILTGRCPTGTLSTAVTRGAARAERLGYSTGSVLLYRFGLAALLLVAFALVGRRRGAGSPLIAFHGRLSTRHPEPNGQIHQRPPLQTPQIPNLDSASRRIGESGIMPSMAADERDAARSEKRILYAEQDAESRPSARQMMCAALNDAAFDWGEAERLANLRDFQVLSQLRALREELSHA